MESPEDGARVTEAVVCCRGVTKTYGRGTAAVHALRGVDLDVYSGELLMLVGPSGCGKTTLISIIAGMLDRDEGACSVLGDDYVRMTKRNQALFRGRNIGFVFQAFNLIPALSAVENAAVPLVINGEKRRAALQQASDILKSVGFDDRMMRARPRDLSGGQQQRVAIARSMVHNPWLIVCDEPTSALDRQTGQEMAELMRCVALASNRALVVVTHDERILGFADRIARMEDGRITDVDKVTPHPTNSFDRL